ncbi:hypothetical protein ACFL56_01630 [Candidatus Margulisiibacteriota bacterium]
MNYKIINFSVSSYEILFLDKMVQYIPEERLRFVIDSLNSIAASYSFSLSHVHIDAVDGLNFELPAVRKSIIESYLPSLDNANDISIHYLPLGLSVCYKSKGFRIKDKVTMHNFQNTISDFIKPYCKNNYPSRYNFFIQYFSSMHIFDSDETLVIIPLHVFEVEP